MTDRCRWVSSDQPRVLPNRHHDGCEDETCRGCQPCPMDHCRVCGIEHASGACANCRSAIRDSLDDVVRMCGSLPSEVVMRGVNGEAMNLLGPVSDPEARQHWEASVLAGRIVPLECEARELADVRRWLDTVDDERHPLLVLGSWSMIYRDGLEHDEPTSRVTVASEAAYLSRHLTEIAALEWVPFEDFARDLRACIAHMEQVLHDGEQIDRGAPCMTCGKPLERVWGLDLDHDGWKCPRCLTTSTDAQYRFAVAHLHREEATHLTDRDMEIRTGVKAGTVRVWAQRGLITRHVDAGRVLFSVAEVEAEARQRGLLAS